MISLSIGSATEVYNNASRCEIFRHWVEHPALAGVSRSLRELFQSLGDEAEDEFWRRTLGPIRKLAFAFCSVPLPFAQATKAIGVNWEVVNRQVCLCSQMFPDSHAPLANLVQRLIQLSDERYSPLIAPLEDLLQCSSVYVMIQNPRMNKAAEAYFADAPKLRNAKVVSATQLRGAHVCDVLVTIGPCKWFPEYIFSAPRAGAIHVISFSWIRDSWKPGPIFLHNTDAAGRKNHNHRLGKMPRVESNSSASPSPQDPPDIQPADLLPPLPAFNRCAIQKTGLQFTGTEETVPARPCHLCGNRAVLVAAGDGATSLIIDTSETGRASVRRVPTEELEPGFYLLLRKSGGGDFIAPLADRILGDRAISRRSQQVEWKQKLISSACERFGSLGRRELATRIASDLKLQRLSQAKPANVHYWMSAKCISPRKAEDFSAIMTFAGLKERAQELRAAMEDIDRAHKRAGFLITQMLLQKIAATSLEPLERNGEMVFDLGDQDGGTLSAFQIVAIEEEEIEIPANRIGVLLDTEE